MSEFLNLVRPQKGDKDGENNEMKYNPQCGVSKEVFEWRCRQHERVSSRTPELMRKMRGLTERMRKHFEDDVEGLKHWDVYERNVLYAYEHNLQSSLSRPVMIPNSILYKDLMRRQMNSKTPIVMISEGVRKFKYGRLVGAVVAAGLAFGLAVGWNSWKQQKTK
ncbi:unnamed protein product [Urochloa decumbens]|uniref:Uncharacterized protein n=1 Tax=Urochloa decumbens TaxID=240449 RepID=A0ABC9CBN7_9POAL